MAMDAPSSRRLADAQDTAVSSEFMAKAHLMRSPIDLNASSKGIGIIGRMFMIHGINSRMFIISQVTHNEHGMFQASPES